ncbi:hypothetical protein [Thiomicrospira microaerophila]|uniref:hypothetical protein n=1 Tax=Thiomicrospira microaerophila TaxID=406020 RepID=UPI0005C9D085|nr:hypothetical protein [Thiomicrospira microaerophila]
MRYWILITFTLLTGCAQLSEKTDLSTQQVLQTHKTIDIAPNTTRRFIQHGELTTRFGFDRREQHCRLELRTFATHGRTVQPDQFLITRIRFDSEAIAMRPHLLAAGQGVNLMLAMEDNGPPDMMELIIIDLASTRQPDVMRLICAGALSNGNPIDYPRNLRPQLKQINSILGDYGQVKIP